MPCFGHKIKFMVLNYTSYTYLYGWRIALENKALWDPRSDGYAQQFTYARNKAAKLDFKRLVEVIKHKKLLVSFPCLQEKHRRQM